MMDIDTTDSAEKDNDSSKDTEQHSNASNASVGDLNDLNDDSLADEMDVSDVSSSIAENENDSKTPSPRKKPKKRQPPIMIGYKKRRKVHSKKPEDDSKTESEIGSPIHESIDEKSADESKKLDQSSASSDDNASETSSTKSTTRSVSMVDKYCWICHRDGANSYKCIACPRVYHPRCLTHQVEDPNNFHCPECSAILKADNVNTRSPIMQAVNLDQLCALLKHILQILKNQKDAHYFYGPVDTREFPHYREYVVYPMDISIMEKNIKNKVYGCTEAFLADVKWIVHNSIVFNSKTAKITNVAKNLLKTCKREVAEIETCAECYYNLLSRKETWFIEVCKRPHILIWARLKGYPPWPAKALKCRNELVDCRFFGAHDKAWVPLKDIFLYSKVSPQVIKIKPGSNLDEGVQECERHIKKLKEKYNQFVYPEYRVPYNPAKELEQLQMMLPYYNTNVPTKSTVKLDRSKAVVRTEPSSEESTASSPLVSREKSSTSESKTVPEKTESSSGDSESEKISIDMDDLTPETTKTTVSSTATSVTSATTTTPPPAAASLPPPATKTTTTTTATSEAKKTANTESIDSHISSSDESKNANDDESSSTLISDERSQTSTKISTNSNSAGSDKSRDTTDTEAEESDSSRSSTKSSTSARETPQKSEPSGRKTVSVKNIAKINATVPTAEKSVSVTTPVPVVSITVPGLIPSTAVACVSTLNNLNITPATGQMVRKSIDTKMEMVRSMRSIDDGPNKKLKSMISVKNFASFDKCDSNLISKSSTPAPPLAPISTARKELTIVAKAVTTNASNEHDFDLDKVKEEPIEVDSSQPIEDPIFVKEIPPPPPSKVAPASKPAPAKNISDAAHRKRSIIEENDATSTTEVASNKKAKNDPGCRTVNITENVTLSLINNQIASVVENVPTAIPTKTQPVLKPKPPATTKAYVVATNVSSNDTSTSTVTKPVRIAPAPAPPAIRMFTTTAQQRIVNGNANAINGPSVAQRSNILVVQSPKQPVKSTLFGPNGSGDIIAQFMSELLNNNRKAMEDALDKIAGKGDLRAKVLLLQKEIENMKRNHEMIIEEIKRDYEVQIAELRAASIAQKKYDLAHERLKFEKEKELAVKEAKSKQWCSNCQKSANYYCCWNTAYCDFECQKEHWNQHMHVCKNDVKRKAAECSENEPPRIMMQNDVLNDYKTMMNGYDKLTPATYTYQNSNNVTSTSRSNGGGPKIQIKSTNSKNAQRPLLPRVTATVTCSPSGYASSTPSVTATLVDSSFQNVSSTVTPLRSTMIGSVNVHPLIRQAQQQYHK